MEKFRYLKDCDFGGYSKEEAFMIAQMNDVNNRAFMRRLKMGWDIEEAMTIPVREKKRNSKITDFLPVGTTVKYWQKRCEENGVRWMTFYQRMIKGTWNVEIACKLKSGEQNDMITVKKKFHVWKKVQGEWKRFAEDVKFKISAADYFRWE